MRLLFTVFQGNLVRGKKKPIYEELIETALPIDTINPLLDINDGFNSVLFVGRTLSFWDITCYHGQESTVIERIKNIPRGGKKQSQNKREPSAFIIRYYNQGNTDDIIEPDFNKCYYYQISKFECGASGFGEIIANPYVANILCGLFLYGVTTVLPKLIKRLKNKKEFVAQRNEEPIVFNAKRFRKRFSKMTRMRKEDFQIADLDKKGKRKRSIRVRTVENKEYEVVAFWNGDIETFHDVTDQRGKE